jgi:cytoskeletal protein CcmA (bactofilin family)
MVPCDGGHVQFPYPLPMWPFRERSGEHSIPTFEVENTIGVGSRVRGDLSGAGGFRIDGAVQGSVVSEGPVVIGERGSVEGGVHGRDVVVLGRVRGDVHASGHLEVGPNGKVLGDVTVLSFRMHKGGVFRGTSCMASGEEHAASSNDVRARVATIPLDETEAPRGRTLPPPNGAVPPPAPLGELAVMMMANDEAVSEQRLISAFDDDDESSPRGATGT